LGGAGSGAQFERGLDSRGKVLPGVNSAEIPNESSRGEWLASSGDARPEHDMLARTLTGALPCIRCKYDLRGLSIRDTCPECGLPIRATLLSVVDPAANELTPLPYPRLLVGALLAWSFAGAAAVFGVWLLIGTEVAVALGRPPHAARELLLWFVVVAVGVSGLAGSLLVFPTARAPEADRLRNRLLAATAITAYVPVGVLLWSIHSRIGWSIEPGTFVYLGRIDPERSVLRLAMGLMLVVILEGLRPNLRMLAARSLVLRTGRVDRQSMHALAGSVFAVMVGDALHFAATAMGGTARDVTWVAGVFLIATGSLFFTAGMLGLVRDCGRVAAVLLEPAPALESVVSEGPPADGTRA